MTPEEFQAKFAIAMSDTIDLEDCRKLLDSPDPDRAFFVAEIVKIADSNQRIDDHNEGHA